MAPHSSTLAWKIPWTEEPGRLQSMGSLRVRHDWATSLSLFTFMHWRRKWQPTPVLLPGLSPRDDGVWWAAIYGIAQSRTRLKWLSSSSSSSNVLEYREKVTQLGEGFGYRLAIKYTKSMSPQPRAEKTNLKCMKIHFIQKVITVHNVIKLWVALTVIIPNNEYWCNQIKRILGGWRDGSVCRGEGGERKPFHDGNSKENT